MSTKKVAGAAPTAPATGQETGVEASFPIPILPDDPADVKVIKTLQGMKVDGSEIVEVVREIYKGFDKSLISKCKKFEHYGVGLRAPAVALLRERFGLNAPEPPAQPRRQRPNRCQCRLADDLYASLQRHLARTGQTMQAYLEDLIRDHLNKEEPDG